MDTVREPLLVLDEDLQIVVASRSFYRTFEMTRPATQGHKIYDLEDGLWDIPELRLLRGQPMLAMAPRPTLN